MARARNIKPAFFTNEELVELPFETRLLFIGLWTLADREGRLEDRPRRIQIEIFPADPVNVDQCLDQLQERGFVLRYAVDGVRYIQVLNFSKHQRPHSKEQESTIPAPDSAAPKNAQVTTRVGASNDLGDDKHALIPDTPFSDTPCADTPHTDGANAPMACDPPYPQEPAPKPPKYPEHFETFWRAYPSGHGVKKQAFEQWRKIPASERQAVMDGLAAWMACDRWQRGYVKDAQRWLRDRQWQDEPPAAPASIAVIGTGPPNPNKRGGYTAGELIEMARQEQRRETS